MGPLIKKMILAGLGMEEKARRTFEELIRLGEENQEEYAQKARKFAASVEKDLINLEGKEREFIKKVVEKLPLATRADIERLEAKIGELAGKPKKG